MLERNQPLSVGTLIEKYHERIATVAVVGLGYVGLPLARALIGAKFRVIGLDIDEAKIEALKRGASYIAHLSAEMFISAIEDDRFHPNIQF